MWLTRMNPGAIWGLFYYLICIFEDKFLYCMKVDLNKNRITEKKGKVINYKEVKDFNKLHPEYNLKKTDIIKIMRAFNTNMADETMNNIYGIIFPSYIGVLFINNAGKPRKKPIDYAKSKETGQTVYHKNWDTDNNMMRLVYINRTKRTIIKNASFFTFNPLQAFRRKASGYFKKHWARCLTVNYNSTVDIKI
jgi:hypothetical protein